MKRPTKYRKINLKWNKYRTIVFSTLTLSGLIVLIGSFAYRKIDIINFEGSSTVKPLIDAFATPYLANNSNVDIAVQAGGSGAGLLRVINHHTNFGNYSYFVDQVATKNQSACLNERLKTITLAWDGIGLVYKQPTNCNRDLVISQNNVNLLYAAFSGHKLADTNFNYTYADLVNANDASCNVKLSTYSRAGGSKRSGTAEAFLHANQIFNFDQFEQKYHLQAQALLNGDYGQDIKTVETAEANSAAWSTIEKDNLDGSMIYLSMGFILNNWQAIHDRGFKLAGYQGFNGTIVNLTPDNFQNEITKTYQWFRPLNTIASLNDLSEASKRFIESILNPAKNDIITKLGFVPLTKEQLATMRYQVNNPASMWNFSDLDLGYYGAKTKI
ncbi:Phosphate ABC transporter, substrate-binding protein PstS [[Mycoplasma] cavipharyngis]|uniref:PstS family phosphate ABC transporter substrate-binding protein n=1 Tax=[Mycoplasma] cavipharyngis TaxID=92757 RepID=UPI0037045C98